MRINRINYDWRGSLSFRANTKYLVFHHAAISKASADDIHRMHLGKAWTGIGYHFYIRKNGNIYTGRPINTIGAHCSGYNAKSIGVCFEGDFEKETISQKQLESGVFLLDYVREIYPNIIVKKHSELNATACPGKNFPLDKLLNPYVETAADIIKMLKRREIITNSILWINKMQNKSNAYWLGFKVCNYTKNCPVRLCTLRSVNDIVWELSQRGIITDKELWLKLLEEDVDLYHLAFKACNMTENKGAV